MSTQVLIIEDDTQIRENLAEMLSLHGYEVDTAINGREGISQAMLRPPQLILCDIMMPEVDGYQVLDVIRNNQLTATTPFIFLTAKTESADLRRGMAQGADDYLTKPFTLDNLLSSINSRLQREALRKAELKAQLDNYRHNLASVSIHESNTALTGILGFSSLLTDQHQHFTGAEIATMAHMIKVCGLRLKRSLDNIQLMDSLRHMEPANPTYLFYTSGTCQITQSMVNSCMEAIALRQDRRVNYRLEIEEAPLDLSAESLTTCLTELLDNACKFSASDQCVTVQGSVQANQYSLTITNQGQPFPAGGLAQIGAYTQFDRYQYEQQGFGIGLSITQRMLDLNQGSFTIDSPAPGLTVVVVRLPVHTDRA